jgi:hypothetical protein
LEIDKGLMGPTNREVIDAAVNYYFLILLNDPASILLLKMATIPFVTDLMSSARLPTSLKITAQSC